MKMKKYKENKEINNKEISEIWKKNEKWRKWKWNNVNNKISNKKINENKKEKMKAKISNENK